MNSVTAHSSIPHLLLTQIDDVPFVFLRPFDIMEINNTNRQKDTQYMTRVLSYNILAGGYNLRDHGTKRTKEICSIIRAAKPDVVGLVEATTPLMTQKPRVLEEIADELGMQLVIGEKPGYD